MDTKRALSTAGALVLVVAGGASALAAARSAPAAVTIPGPGVPPATTIITEYVDPDGNPVAAPGGETMVEVRSLEMDAEVIVVEAAEPEVIWVDAPSTATADGYEYDADEYDDDEHDDDEHDDDEHGDDEYDDDGDDHDEDDEDHGDDD